MLSPAHEAHNNVVDRGTGDPVLFLHGIGCNALTWEPQLQVLESSRRVIAIDARGHGGSPPAEGPMTLRDYADDVLAVMSDLGIERAPVVGLSMGGMVAMTMSLAAPERVSGLVLADTGAHANADMAANMKMAGAAAVEYGMRANVEQMTPMLFAAAALAENRPYIKEFQDQVATTDAHSFSVALGAIAELDLLDDLPRLDVPTLVLVGDEDQTLPSVFSEAIAAAVPGAELQVIDEAGHMSNLDQPEVFTDHLVRFLSRTGN
ncbi:alpha/beta fold hydrolase [Streptomyces hyaluromycini]|uniref:Alpha/beta fold hydrolase n=1 Tax=Streptomyces hyaluromycini TaxID=1377993 RepID=A0ABV1X002_9ACTN